MLDADVVQVGAGTGWISSDGARWDPARPHGRRPLSYAPYADRVRHEEAGQDDRAAEVAFNRAFWGILNERFTDPASAEQWSSPEVVWGLFGVPERLLGVLGDVRGLDVVELAAGTAYFSAWLARAGARPVALDLSGEQMATARGLQRSLGPAFPLVQCDAERVPLASERFDLVVSEHGAAAWCDPARWLPEAARLLRPGGRLVFLTNSLLSALCVPAEEGVAEERMLRGQREVAKVHWPGGGVEFHPSHGDWVRLLRASGFVIEALHELYAPADSGDHPYYEIVSAAWAERWPAEELWVATLTQ
jgi:SAM-dependent methyltransferase